MEGLKSFKNQISQLLIRPFQYLSSFNYVRIFFILMFPTPNLPFFFSSICNEGLSFKSNFYCCSSMSRHCRETLFLTSAYWLERKLFFPQYNRIFFKTSLSEQKLFLLKCITHTKYSIWINSILPWYMGFWSIIWFFLNRITIKNWKSLNLHFLKK